MFMQKRSWRNQAHTRHTRLLPWQKKEIQFWRPHSFFFYVAKSYGAVNRLLPESCRDACPTWQNSIDYRHGVMISGQNIVIPTLDMLAMLGMRSARTKLEILHRFLFSWEKWWLHYNQIWDEDIQKDCSRFCILPFPTPNPQLASLSAVLLARIHRIIPHAQQCGIGYRLFTDSSAVQRSMESGPV